MRSWCLRFALIAGTALALGLLLWLLHRPLLCQVGEILVFESPEFEQADAVVVLPGSVPDRALGALDLLRESRAPLVLLGRDRATGDLALLDELGIERPRDFELNREILLRLGISPDAIRLLPANSSSTAEDAESLRRYLEQSGVRSVALVTCKYHSYRAYLNFRERLQGTGVTVYSAPSSHCRFDPRRWWRDRNQAKTVYLEMGKLLAYWLGFS